MALLTSEIQLAASPAAAWDVIGDFAAGPVRMAPGFVTTCDADGDVRVVTFADGTVVHERLVAVDDAARSITYSVVGGSISPDRDVAEMRIVPDGDGCRLVWTHDVDSDEFAPALQAAMAQGAEAIRRTLDAVQDLGPDGPNRPLGVRCRHLFAVDPDERRDEHRDAEQPAALRIVGGDGDRQLRMRAEALHYL